MCIFGGGIPFFSVLTDSLGSGGQRLEQEAGAPRLRVHCHICYRELAQNVGPRPVPSPRGLHEGRLERHGHIRGVLCPPFILFQVKGLAFYTVYTGSYFSTVQYRL